MADTLSIASWNINSVRARIDIVERFLTEEAPDILCLQETKVEDQLFPSWELEQAGYRSYWYGQKTYNGVAILSKYPIKDSFSIDLYNEDRRHICAKINDFEGRRVILGAQNRPQEFRRRAKNDFEEDMNQR